MLAAVPGSRLRLKSLGLSDPAAAGALRGRFAALGVAPQRLELLPYAATLEQHLRCYDGVDLALDTFPCNGTTTTCEALWMGVPVVSLAGRTHVARVGGSLLAQVGLAELGTADPSGFVAAAVALAGDLPRLEALRVTPRRTAGGCSGGGRRIPTALHPWRRPCGSSP